MYIYIYIYIYIYYCSHDLKFLIDSRQYNINVIYDWQKLYTEMSLTVNELLSCAAF